MVTSIKSRIRNLPQSRLFLPALFGIIAALCAASYMSVRNIMIVGNTWLYVIESNITLNFILFLLLWGVTSDRITKGKARRVQWGFFAGGMVGIILFFRFVGGFPTVLG